MKIDELFEEILYGTSADDGSFSINLTGKDREELIYEIRQAKSVDKQKISELSVTFDKLIMENHNYVDMEAYYEAKNNILKKL